MFGKKRGNTIFFVAIGVAVVIIVACGIWFWLAHRPGTTAKSNLAPGVKVMIPGAVPPGFLVGFPLYHVTSYMSSSNASLPSGISTASRVFYSSDTPSQVRTFYETYLPTQGWKVNGDTSVASTNSYFISATGKSGRVTVQIGMEARPSGTPVSVTFFEIQP